MMEGLYSLGLYDPNLLWVLAGIICMNAGAAVVGTFTFLQKRSLIGDTISHAILPGICLAFLITQTKDSAVLLLGAIVSGYLGLLCTQFIIRRSPLKPDAALGIVLSVFYGLGILLLTMIQQSGIAAQSGLDKFLFGKAAALMPRDIWILGGCSLLILLVIGVIYPQLKIVVFDREYAQTKGLPVNRLEGLLSFLTVLSIAIGIQAIGVVLMSALLIAPVVSARYWTHKLHRILIWAVVFAAFSGLGGVWVSYQYARMPTGPWVVVWLSLFSFASILLGAEKGVISRWYRQRKHKTKSLHENILKALYQLGEYHQDFSRSFPVQQIQERRYLPLAALKKGLRYLERKGWVSPEPEGVRLTPAGKTEGERMVRIHRLWELYLTTHLNLPSDHVHDNAEAIEHIITPELEVALTQSLEHPLTDPHESPIPYASDKSR